MTSTRFQQTSCWNGAEPASRATNGHARCRLFAKRRCRAPLRGRSCIAHFGKGCTSRRAKPVATQDLPPRMRARGDLMIDVAPPATRGSSPEMNDLIAHLRDVLGDQTYESLA